MNKLVIKPSAKEVLKNFSGFNNSITLSSDTIYTSAKNYGLGIYKPNGNVSIDGELSLMDINNFLSLMGDNEEIDIKVHEFYADIKIGKSKIKYGVTEKALTPMHNQAIDDALQKSSEVIKFNLSIDQIQEIKRYRSLLNISDVKLVNTNGEVELIIYNELQDGNTYQFKIDVEIITPFKEIKLPKNILNEKDISFEKIFLDEYEVTVTGIEDDDMWFIKYDSVNYPLEYIFIAEVAK